jgi:3-oxoacyl-[acyl-carrier protein] reductase
MAALLSTPRQLRRNGVGGGLYGSSKFFVSNVTRGMAKEQIGYGIRVNGVASGRYRDTIS